MNRKAYKQNGKIPFQIIVDGYAGYQDGFKVFHNFVRKNARQGLTPADKVGIGIKGNAWETMLLNSIKSQTPVT